MTYSVLTQDDLAKWWITGTGSVVNRLSEVMDDQPDGPAIFHLDADNAWTAGTGSEWYVATATKPDNVADNLSGWTKLTGTADNNDGSLAVDEWTYNTTSNRVYVRLSDSSDPNATDMRKHYAWDGSGAGPVIMTEVLEDECYVINLTFWIGDNSTSTTLTSENEFVALVAPAYFDVKVNGSLTLGRLIGDWGVDGSRWHQAGSATVFHGGTINIYASTLHTTEAAAQQFNVGVLKVKRGILSHVWSTSAGGSSRRYNFKVGLTTLELEDVYLCNVTNMWINKIPDVISNIHVHSANRGLEIGAAGMEIDGLLMTSMNLQDVFVWSGGEAYDVTALDPVTAISGVIVVGNEASFIRESYTCNINITDRDGTALENVIVDCEDTDTNAVWAAGTITTDANGDIAEQKIQFKRWTGTSETLKDYSPHKFTLSKAGYKTLIIDGVTVDRPILWQHELQTPKAPPRAWRH